MHEDGITRPDCEILHISEIVPDELSEGAAIVTPLDSLAGGHLDARAVINIARLLRSLDALPGDEGIILSDTLSTTVRDGNEALPTSIEVLDFHDDLAFVNAASQIVAVLTACYAFTGTLVDSETARQHLTESLAGLEIDRVVSTSVD